jgi:hypothetical protein
MQKIILSLKVRKTIQKNWFPMLQKLLDFNSNPKGNPYVGQMCMKINL